MDITTAALRVIRESIEPNRGWWQRPLKTWHLVVAVSAAAVVGAALVAWALIAVGAA